MNVFQRCPNTSEAVPLYLPQRLFLKPRASITISVHLSQKIMGKTIMHGEMIQKLKELVTPDDFASVKVIKSTVEMVRLEAEVELKSLLQRVVGKVDKKYIKLQDFKEVMLVKASISKSTFPSRHECDAFFRDAKDMDENKPGERPDTVHLANLPSKWFVPNHLQHREDVLPSEKLFYYTFEKFGHIRHVDIPICDPYRCKMKAHITGMQTSSFEERDFFEAYVQFKDYIGFTKCMDALRGMQLMRKDENHGDAHCVNIFVTFDKTKHLSEGSIRRREILRERLILKQKSREEREREKREQAELQKTLARQKTENEKSEKERRRKEREEKRKAKILAELKRSGNSCDDFIEKIAKEEEKLLKVQRRLEAIRLVEVLFNRIKVKLQSETKIDYKTNNELTKMRVNSEQEVKSQREKLHKAIEGRVILKSIIATESKRLKEVESSDSDEQDKLSDLSIEDTRNGKSLDPAQPTNLMQQWYQHYLTNPPPMFAPYSTVPPPSFYPAGRPWFYHQPVRGGRASSSRGGFQRRPYRGGRGRGHHQSYVHHDDRYRSGRSRSTSTRRSTKTRSRSRSRSRRRARSYTRSRSYSRSRSHSTKRRTWSRSRTPEGTPPTSNKGHKSRRNKRSRTRSRSRSQT